MGQPPPHVPHGPLCQVISLRILRHNLPKLGTVRGLGCEDSLLQPPPLQRGQRKKRGCDPTNGTLMGRRAQGAALRPSEPLNPPVETVPGPSGWQGGAGAESGECGCCGSPHLCPGVLICPNIR